MQTGRKWGLGLWAAFLAGTVGIGCSSGSTSNPGDLVEACARASACVQGDDPWSMSQNCSMLLLVEHERTVDTSTEMKLTASLLDCVRAGADCGAVRACMQASDAEAAACAAGSGNDRCAGQVLVECEADPDGAPDAFDCAAAGLVCAEGASDAGCGEAACDPAAFTDRCDGDVFESCDAGTGVTTREDCRFSVGYHCTMVGQEFVCAPYGGGTCGPDDEAELGCVGAGAACDVSTFAARCDGDTLVSCRGGKEARLDCKALHPDTTCGMSPDEMLNCVPAKTECTLATAEGCDNGVITFCLLGEVATVDCKSLGLSGCTTTSLQGRTLAACVP